MEAIGRVVREFRDKKHLSREGLAERTHVPADEIAALEDGLRLLSTGKLERIAGVLGLEPFSLFDGCAIVKPDVALFFRHGSIPDFFDEDLDRLRPAVDAGLALLNVNAVLRRPPGLRARFAPEPVGDKPHESGYAAARLVRTALGYDSAPITDLRAVIEDRFDVVIVAARLRTRSVLAVTVKEPSCGGAAIVLGPAQGDSRRSPLVDRVSLAHELAHVLFDAEPLVVDLRAAADPASSGPIEQRAGAFAAELLIPCAGLLARFGSPQRIHSPPQADKLIDEVRAAYLTPVEITVNHLMNHGYILKDETLRQNLIKAAKNRTDPMDFIEIPRVAPAEGAPSIALTERVREAHDRTLITDGRAREVLGIPLGAPLPWEA